MEAQGGGGLYSSDAFTTLALDGVSGQHHNPAAFYPRYPLNRRLGPPEPVWTEVRGKISCLCQRSNPDCLVIQSVLRHYTD
jgi:hypothetical protein